MSQAKIGFAILVMIVAEMVLIKIPYNRHSNLIGVLTFIILLGTGTLGLVSAFRHFKSLSRSVSQGTWTKTRRSWIALILFVVTFICVFEVGSDRYSRSLPIYRNAINVLDDSDAAKSELGGQIRIGWPIAANLEWKSDMEDAELEIPVSGERGKGTFFVIGRKTNGEWRTEQLYLIMSGRTKRENLLAVAP